MWANSVWGFLTLGIGLLVTMLTLSPDQEWLRPWLLGIGPASIVLSAIILIWPLRHKDVRAKAQEAARHPLKWFAQNLEPRHLLIVGLTGVVVFAAIALAGVIWQGRDRATSQPARSLVWMLPKAAAEKFVPSDRDAAPSLRELLLAGILTARGTPHYGKAGDPAVPIPAAEWQSLLLAGQDFSSAVSKQGPAHSYDNIELASVGDFTPEFWNVAAQKQPPRPPQPPAPVEPDRYYSSAEKERIGGLIATIRLILNREGKTVVREVNAVAGIPPGAAKQNVQDNYNRLVAAEKTMHVIYDGIWRNIINNNDNSDLLPDLKAIIGPNSQPYDRFQEEIGKRMQAFEGILAAFDLIPRDDRERIINGLNGSTDLRDRAEKFERWITDVTDKIDTLNRKLAK